MALPARSLYFENTAGRLWEEPEGFVRVEYQAGRRQEIELRSLLTHATHALRRRSWTNLLIDQRVMSPFTPAEQRWLTETWLPEAIREAGYRYGAVVMANDVFARLAMTQITMTTRDHHTYRNFEDEAAAQAWLLQAR